MRKYWFTGITWLIQHRRDISIGNYSGQLFDEEDEYWAY